MAGAVEGVRVKGLREFVRACNVADRDTKKLVRTELAEAAEPVRRAAESKATSEIRNIGSAWNQMRTGVAPRLVYIAPRQRRHGGSPRPNLGRLLLKQMIDALQENRAKVEAKVEEALDRITSRNF